MGRGCASFCKSYLVALNTLVVLVGLAITGIGIYLAVDYYQNNSLFQGSTGLWVVWAPIAVGLLLTSMALTGCCIAMNDRRCLQGCWGVIYLFFTIVVAACGAFLLVYIGYMYTISTTSVVSLAAGLGGSQQYLSDYTIGIFAKCCPGGEFVESGTSAIEQCPTTQGTGINAYCYYSPDSYDAGYSVDSDACSLLLSSGSIGACPSASPGNSSDALGVAIKNFQGNLHMYMKSYWWPSGIAFCVFAGILFFATIGAFYLACRSRAQPERYYINQPAEGVAGTRTGKPVAMV